MLPRRYLPSIPSLLALEALDRLGTASAAAAELSLTQGAISKQLQVLEGQLGVSLLIREGKRLILAPAARDLSGVTALRAGVYMFFDLVMTGIDVCTVDDIALSVLTTVIGHQQDKGWIMIDAGWMAMSRDRGTAAQDLDQGYGVVCDADGRVMRDLIVSGANQEHGILSLRPGAKGPLPELPVGRCLRILPNHACATAAQFDRYNLLPAGGGPLQVWHRFGGW